MVHPSVLTTAGVLTIGREVLSGQVVDTNASWISQALIRKGLRVMRRVTVDDDPAEITRGLRFLEEVAGLIVTTGGMGPTDDDRTVEVVAAHLGRRLVRIPEIEHWIRERHLRLRGDAARSPAYRRAQQKMATLPDGARWIPNPVGSAPGIWLSVGGRVYLLLPGVPRELEALLPLLLEQLRDRLPRGVYVEVLQKGPVPYEAQMAQHLERLRQAFPDLYIKTHVGDGTLKLHLSTFAPDREQGRQRIQQAMETLKRWMKEDPYGQTEP